MNKGIEIGGIVLGAGLLIASGVALAKDIRNDNTRFLEDFCDDDIDEDVADVKEVEADKVGA